MSKHAPLRHAPRVFTPQNSDDINPHALASLSPIFTDFCLRQTIQSDPAEHIDCNYAPPRIVQHHRVLLDAFLVHDLFTTYSHVAILKNLATALVILLASSLTALEQHQKPTKNILCKQRTCSPNYTIIFLLFWCTTPNLPSLLTLPLHAKILLRTFFLGNKSPVLLITMASDTCTAAKLA
jgi:hypothetical protein